MPLCLRGTHFQDSKVNLFLEAFFIGSRILLTGDFIFSSSFDKTAKAWLFDVSELGEGNEERACIRTFKGHSKGVYPMVFIPAPDNLGDEDEGEGPNIRPGDMLLTGSADMTARSWRWAPGTRGETNYPQL